MKIEREIKKAESELDVQKEVVELLKKGVSPDEIYKALRKLGYTYSQCEDFLTQADIIIHKQKKIPIDYSTIGLVFLLILALLTILSLFGFQIFPGGKDCGEDLFCVDKLTYCKEGVYTSSYAGITKSYRISKELTGCRVYVKVESAPKDSEEKQGMDMLCLHPIENGITKLIDQYKRCNGTLAELWKRKLE